MNAVVDGSGLYDTDQDKLTEHSTDTSAMWLSNLERYNDGIVFEFDKLEKLDKMVVWNYNQTGYVDYGVAKTDISVWTENEGWKKAKQGVIFDKAEGTYDYDSPMVINLDLVEAQKVRFENITSWNTDNQVGLSEVRFYSPLGAHACNPEPANKTIVTSIAQTHAEWTAGKDAVVHKVYLGATEDSLELLGAIKGKPELTFSGLVPNADYFWRVDEVNADGVTTEGAVWSFETKGDLIAHWAMDDNDGTIVSDSNNSVRGNLAEGPIWQADSGKFGGALQLDGKDDYIIIPEPVKISNDYSISVWFKNSTADEAMDIVAATGNGDHGILLELYKDKIRYLHRKPFGTKGGTSIALEGKYADGNWHHLTAVNTAKMNYVYIDGQQAASMKNACSQFDDELDFVVGKIDQDRAMRNFEGLIDEVYLFNYALNDDQVKSLYRENVVEKQQAGKVELFDVAFVEGESLAEIVKQAEEAKQYEEVTSVGQQEDEPEKFNFSAIIIIAAVMVIVAAVSLSRKKK